MKQLKRSLALLLAVAVLGGLFIGSISAIGKDPHEVKTGDLSLPSYTDVDGTHANADAIYGLTAMNVLSGYTDGSYKPEGTITRAEFAVFVYRMMGYGEKDKAYFAAKTSAFADVPEGHWAEAFINACADGGIFVGYPDGSFKPDMNVSKAEVITVVLRCLGYDKNLPGEWPANYVNKAVNMKLLDLEGFVADQFATRAEVAQYCFDAMQYGLVVYIGKESLGVVAGYVDRDGYMYINGRTNEFELYYNSELYEYFRPDFIPMMAKLGYGMMGFDGVFASGTNGNLKEAASWGFGNADGAKAYKNGDLCVLNAWAEMAMPLADLYYISGGDVTALGNIKDAFCIFKLENNEVVFVSAGTPDPDYEVDEATPFYVVVSADEKTVVCHPDVNGGEPIDLTEEAIVFYDIDKHEFIKSTDLLPGDVLYYAGEVGEYTTDENKINVLRGKANGVEVALALVQHPVTGDFTEFDDAPEKYVVIDGVKYLVAVDGEGDNTYYTFDGAESFKDFTKLTQGEVHENLSSGDTDVTEFGDILYAIHLSGKLAYIGKDMSVAPAADTYGVVTSLKITDMGLIYDPSANNGAGGLNHLYMYTGFTITLPDLTTKDVDFTAKTTVDGEALENTEIADPEDMPVALGDLITVNGNNIFTQASNTIDKLYGFYYEIADAEIFDKVTPIGTRLNLEWGEAEAEEETTEPTEGEGEGEGEEEEAAATSNNDAHVTLEYTGTHEVYTTNETSFAFYVTVKGTKVTVEILDQAAMNAKAEYNQFETFKFYNADKTGLAVAYATGKKTEAPAPEASGLFQFGFANDVSKTVDGWQLKINGKKVTVAKDAVIHGVDGEDLDMANFSGNALVLYNLKNGKVNELHVIADPENGLTQEYEGFDETEQPFGLGETEFNINPKNHNTIFKAGITSVSLSGDPRVEVDGVIDPPTVFVDGAIIYDLTSGKVVETKDLTKLVPYIENGDVEIAFIGDEPTNLIYYIIITNAAEGGDTGEVTGE
jgi:hypothetical protein